MRLLHNTILSFTEEQSLCYSDVLNVNPMLGFLQPKRQSTILTKYRRRRRFNLEGCGEAQNSPGERKPSEVKKYLLKEVHTSLILSHRIGDEEESVGF